MPEEREQSPHYIPELDPEHPKHAPGPFASFILRFLWLAFFGGLVFLTGAGVAWYAGMTELAIGLAAVSVVMLILFFSFGGFG